MKKNILILGDIHGNFSYVKDYINRKKITDCIIIQVGDFGIGFTTIKNDTNILTGLNGFLKSKNIIMYVIRGNHDNPDFFKGNHIYDNLKLLKDYTIENINGENFLFIGGAISIDRQIRLAEEIQFKTPPTYWLDERFELDTELVENVENVDVVITHTAPNLAYPSNTNGFPKIVLNFAYTDLTLLNDLTDERNNMDILLDRLKIKNNIKKWYYGHFHTSKKEIIDGIEFNLVDICNFIEHYDREGFYN